MTFQKVDPNKTVWEKFSEQKIISTGSYGSRYGSNESLETQYEEFEEDVVPYVNFGLLI